LHAFGYAVPVILSENSKSHGPEISLFSDNENGLSFKDGCINDLSISIIKLMKDPLLRKKLSQNALKTTKNYTTSTMVHSFYEVFKKVSSNKLH
jgi:hypothetical protein